MTETAHTPWTVEVDEDFDGRPRHSVVDSRGRCIACSTTYYPTAITADAARFIVHAVNSHDDMLAALNWYAEQAAGCRKITSEGDAARSALDRDGGERAIAAISAATPKEG